MSEFVVASVFALGCALHSVGSNEGTTIAKSMECSKYRINYKTLHYQFRKNERSFVLVIEAKETLVVSAAAVDVAVNVIDCV